jgi:hypothetical protein
LGNSARLQCGKRESKTDSTNPLNQAKAKKNPIDSSENRSKENTTNSSTSSSIANPLPQSLAWKFMEK